MTSSLVALVLSGQQLALADDGWGEVVEPTEVFDTRIYGFIDSYYEKIAKTPTLDENGDTLYESNVGEFDVLNLNVMIQGSIYGRYRYYLNFASPGAGGIDDEGLGVRNAWVEAPLRGDLLKVRAGKLYRRFGLYNEILDAVPTFIGIEPPELFDKDHLMVTRTTNLMLFGAVPLGGSMLHYSVATGNDERAGSSIPIGADAYVDLGGTLRVGSSFYSSGEASPTRAVGEGSPRGGVVNWMASDQYMVYGGYTQLTLQGLVVQAEYWRADHDATRDEESVLALVDADLNDRQLERFYVGGDATNGVSPLTVQYTVQTAYLRAGYQIPIGRQASLTPYVQGDFYENPEVIESKDFGGDAEAGRSDNGQFFKYTAGTVIRPVPQVAFKIDGSAHQLMFNGESVFYPEIRFSLSYLWQLDQ